MSQIHYPRLLVAVALLNVWLLFPSHAYAVDGNSLEQRVAQLEAAAKPASPVNSGDNAWLLVSAAMVLMMTAPGLILF